MLHNPIMFLVGWGLGGWNGVMVELLQWWNCCNGGMAVKTEKWLQNPIMFLSIVYRCPMHCPNVKAELETLTNLQASKTSPPSVTVPRCAQTASYWAGIGGTGLRGLGRCRG